jgi:hypothetical protein
VASQTEDKIMPKETWNVLSDDLGKSIQQLLTTLTSIVVDPIMGRWGSAQFGTNAILGGGLSNTYLTGDRNVLSAELDYHVQKRTVRIVAVSMISKMGNWGSAQFGTVDILGAGTLSEYDA